LPRPILFLSDYGLEDELVGTCHAVIARLAPDARVIDLTHAVPPQDVLAGAVSLAAAVPYAPADAVWLAVVDPGVGTERRAVAVEAGKAVLVGPDNGLLSLACEDLGGPARAVAIEANRVAPGPVSTTFHGRDVFAPATALVATGARLDDLGGPVELASLVRLTVPSPEIEPGRLRVRVLTVDRFGNVRLAAREPDLERAGLGAADAVTVAAELAGEEAAERMVVAQRARTYADVPEAHEALIVDSAGWLAVARNLGSAADRLRVATGDFVILSERR
jgi:S-adenosylmethionine hydrolase